MPRISQVLDANFKSGVSQKTNKPWTLMQIQTDDGKTATIFAPAKVGDEVKLTYNDQYKNYNAEKVTAASQYKAAADDKLDTILRSLGRIERHLGITGLEKTEDQPPVENYEEAGPDWDQDIFDK